MRFEVFIVWGAVEREAGKKDLEGLDLSRILGVRGLPTGQW